MKLQLNQKGKKIIERLDIEAVILFGSRAQGLAGTASDFDFGVLLAHSVSRERRTQIYDTLYDLLSSKIKELTNIDIVFLYDAPMELQSHVARYGIPLYERNIHSFARFRERVMNEYADFAPLREVFHKAILSRIP